MNLTTFAFTVAASGAIAGVAGLIGLSQTKPWASARLLVMIVAALCGGFLGLIVALTWRIARLHFKLASAMDEFVMIAGPNLKLLEELLIVHRWLATTVGLIFAAVALIWLCVHISEVIRTTDDEMNTSETSSGPDEEPPAD